MFLFVRDVIFLTHISSPNKISLTRISCAWAHTPLHLAKLLLHSLVAHKHIPTSPGKISSLLTSRTHTSLHLAKLILHSLATHTHSFSPSKTSPSLNSRTHISFRHMSLFERHHLPYAHTSLHLTKFLLHTLVACSCVCARAHTPLHLTKPILHSLVTHIQTSSPSKTSPSFISQSAWAHTHTPLNPPKFLLYSLVDPHMHDFVVMISSQYKKFLYDIFQKSPFDYKGTHIF